MSTPSESSASARAATNLSGFIDAATIAKLSDKEKAEAASAQFYALQYGRPGAPRNWQGDTGASGSIAVGPYVRVNSLDCREFTHKVTVGGAEVVRKGTACREASGGWSVVDAG